MRGGFLNEIMLIFGYGTITQMANITLNLNDDFACYVYLYSVCLRVINAYMIA